MESKETTEEIRIVGIEFIGDQKVLVDQDSLQEMEISDQQLPDQQLTNQDNKRKEKDEMWKPELTKTLITLRLGMEEEFQNSFEPKKKIWEKLAKTFADTTGIELRCEEMDTKWRNVLSTYRKNKLKQDAEPDYKVKWPYFKMMDAVLRNYDIPVPPKRLSVLLAELNSSSTVSSSVNSNSLPSSTNVMSVPLKIDVSTTNTENDEEVHEFAVDNEYPPVKRRRLKKKFHKLPSWFVTFMEKKEQEDKLWHEKEDERWEELRKQDERRWAQMKRIEQEKIEQMKELIDVLQNRRCD